MSLKSATGLTLSLAASLSLLAWSTEGFAVLTTDAARARTVREAPRAVPAVRVRDFASVTHDVLDDVYVARDSAQARSRPRAVIVDFIYTRCITVCSALGGTYQQLQKEIIARGLQDRVRLLTISFDVAFDDPAHLAMHGRVMRAEPAIWTLATPLRTADLDALLNTFGVQVIPNGRGEWVHNAALHVVNPAGDLVRIVDIGAPNQALTAAVQAWEAHAR